MWSINFLGCLGTYIFAHSLYSLFQSHLDSCLYEPTDLDTGEVSCTHSLYTNLGPFPDYDNLVQLGESVAPL